MSPNVKITDLPLATGITSDDILLMVDDPFGTPTTKKISANYVAILDASGRLNNAQLPDNIEARLSVLNDTDAVLSEVTLNTGELAAPTDKGYLRVGDGVTKGGKIIGAGNAYIEKDSTSLPIISYTLVHPNNSGVIFPAFAIIPSQIYQIVINGSGEIFDYPGLWISEPHISSSIGSNISSATYSNVVGITSITITSSLTNCSSISFPNLKIITQNIGSAVSPTGINAIYMPELEVIIGSPTFSSSSLSVWHTPKLKYMGSFNLNQGLPNLQNLELSSLKTVNGTFNPGGAGGNNMNSITKIDAPSLEHVNGAFTLGNMTSLSGIYLPKIKIINGAITFNSTNGSNLSHFNLGSGLVQLNGNISLSGQKLTSDSVNNILIRLAALDGTGQTVIYPSGRMVTLNGGTSAGLSSLSPEASGARNTLITRGVTVSLNA